MADERQSDESRPKSETIAIAKASGTQVPLPASAPPEDSSATPKKLTTEEQMALYEEKLKEEDWGHQPC